MPNKNTVKLSRATFMFPLALVLFEFSVYIGNDLVQPAMLAITQDFNVSSDWAPSSMSFYLLGGAAVAWLLGPLSDHLGRKKVLLAGVLFFSLCCLLILLTQNIESFLTLRFFQGMGLSVITAVGYAAIQEIFDERDAIKVLALMANVSLLAPLLGPLLGAFLIEHISWHWGFIAISMLALLSWFGLKAKMPNTPLPSQKMSVTEIYYDFKQVFSNKKFLGFAFSLPLVSLPLMLWIALSPIMLVESLGLSSLAYGMAQFPVLGGLMLGNVVLIKVIDHLPLGKTVQIGLPMMLFGSLLLLIGTFILPQYFLIFLLLGMTCISFGDGIAFSVLYRFTLMSSEISKGTVAAAVSIILMLSFFFILELARILYRYFDVQAYTLLCVGLIVLWFTAPKYQLKQLMQQRKKQGKF